MSNKILPNFIFCFIPVVLFLIDDKARQQSQQSFLIVFRFYNHLTGATTNQQQPNIFLFTSNHGIDLDKNLFLLEMRFSNLIEYKQMLLKLTNRCHPQTWGSLMKMSKRENLEEVLFDLGDYLQVCLASI